MKILFVEDVINDAELVWREIEKNKILFSKVLVDNRKDYLENLLTFEPDLIISDYALPHFDGMLALQLRNEMSPLIPFILVTGSLNERVAVECMKAGADDYILKDSLSRLGSAIINSIKKIKLIKEKNSIEKELQRSELQLKKAQSLAHVGNWALDFSTKMLSFSEEARNIYGFENKCKKVHYDLIKKSSLPEYRNFLDEKLDRLLKYDEPFEVEFEIARANDGEIRSLFLKAELTSEHNAKEKVIGVIQDITHRKLAEKAIEQERRMLRTLIDNLPYPIYVEDKNCRKVIANKADVENIGLTTEAEVLGKTDLEFFPGSIGERGYAADKKIIGTGKPVFNLEEEFINPVGVKRWLQTTKIPLLDKDGKITGLVGIGHDITERKANLEELIQAKEKAEESDRLKTAFLHNISHEIRTPLNAIVGFATLLGEPDVDNQSRKSYIDTILQSSDHLVSIIMDIVDISNIEANIIKTLKNEISINSILTSLCNQFTPKANEKKIKLVCEPGLMDSESIILCDGNKLTQILSNLVGNALKFTDNGIIKLSYTLKDDFLEFCVVDTGIGVPSEFHKKIFDRFFQVQNNESRLYEGTGLGLAITKAYVEHLGGKIWLTSESGKGTSFFFTIPYEKQISIPIPVFEAKKPVSHISLSVKNILVAEDDESNFAVIRYFLTGPNTKVLRAYNGKEAVEICLSNANIDLILMDVKMPVMDGYTATKLIREINTKIPIIAQTAYADDKEKAFEYGCSGFISKPFNKKSLLDIISDFI